jgi:hypothetical protein
LTSGAIGGLRETRAVVEWSPARLIPSCRSRTVSCRPQRRRDDWQPTLRPASL